MRKYAALYDSTNDRWCIIFQDDYESEWYIDVENVGSKETATRIVDALNKIE